MYNTNNLPDASDFGRKSLALGLEKTIADGPGDSAPHIFTVDKQGDLLVTFELAREDWATILNAIGSGHGEHNRHQEKQPAAVRTLEAYQNVFETIESEVASTSTESGWISISFTMEELNRLFDVTSEAELNGLPFASTSTFTRLESLISRAANARAQIIGRAALLAPNPADEASTDQEDASIERAPDSSTNSPQSVVFSGY